MSVHYLAKLLDDRPATPSAAQIAGMLPIRDFDWADIAADKLGALLDGSSPSAFVRALAETARRQPDLIFDGRPDETGLPGLLPPPMLAALASTRLDLAPAGVDFHELPLGWLATTVLHEEGVPQVPAIPCRRVVIECVTIHPYAGMPVEVYEQPPFVMRLLTDADEEPWETQRMVARLRRYGPNGWSEPRATGPEAEDEITGIIWAVRRLHTIDIEFGDEFWLRHQDTWWANERVMYDEGVRVWLGGPSESAPYQVAAFEVYLHPCWLQRPVVGTFDSAAYW